MQRRSRKQVQLVLKPQLFSKADFHSFLMTAPKQYTPRNPESKTYHIKDPYLHIYTYIYIYVYIDIYIYIFKHSFICWGQFFPLEVWMFMIKREWGSMDNRPKSSN